MPLSPTIDNNRKTKENVHNDNFNKKEFQELWQKINRKAAYTVDLRQHRACRQGGQGPQHGTPDQQAPVSRQDAASRRTSSIIDDDFRQGRVHREGADNRDYNTGTIRSSVKYDLIGEVAESAQLTRRTVGGILKRLELPVFNQFRDNPEDFIAKCFTLDQGAEGHDDHRAPHLRSDRRALRLDIFYRREEQGRLQQGLQGEQPHLRLRLHGLEDRARPLPRTSTPAPKSPSTPSCPGASPSPPPSATTTPTGPSPSRRTK